MINVTRSMDMMDEWGERAVGGVDGLENDLADLSLEQSVKTGLKVTILILLLAALICLPKLI